MWDAKFLCFALAFDVLEKLGLPAIEGLRELSRVHDKHIPAPAKEALLGVRRRGLVDDDEPEPLAQGIGAHCATVGLNTPGALGQSP